MMWLYIQTFIRRAIGTGKKAVIVLFVYLFIIIAFINAINHTKAQRPIDDPMIKYRSEIYQLINSSEQEKDPIKKLAIKSYQLSLCGLVGEACTENPKDGDINYQNSLMGKIGDLIMLPYKNPPASGIYWAYAKLEQSGFVPKTYAAQGVGFASLKPMMNLWSIFRDISYMLLVLVLVSIGFMIMFRTKINPQTVISVENSLPKIVTSLLLITFSYAIAGFLIDVMYLIMIIGISVLSNNNAYFDASVMQNKYISSSPWDIYNSLFVYDSSYKSVQYFGGFLGGIDQLMYMGDAIMGLFPQGFNHTVRIITIIIFILPMLSKFFEFAHMSKIHTFFNNIDILGNSLGEILQSPLKIIIMILIFVFVGIPLIIHGAGFILGIVTWFTMIYLTFRILFLLFKSYLQVLLLTIFSPIILLAEAIPGKSSFSYWIKNMLGYLITFPTVAILFVMGYVMTNSLSYPGDFWNPPFLTNVDPQAFTVLLGIGIMFLIPELVKIVQEQIGAKGVPIGVGPSTFFGGAGAALGGGQSMLSQFSTIKLGMGALGRGEGFLGLQKKKAEEETRIKPPKKGGVAGGTNIDPTET